MNNGIMDELALCAEKLGKVIATHGKYNEHLDAAATSLAAFGGEQIAQMAGHKLSVNTTPAQQPLKAAKKTRPADETQPERKKPGPKPRAAEAPKAARAAKPEAAKAEPGPARTMGVCVICGETYLRRSNVQKTCSAECLEKKRAGLDKHGQPLNGEANQP